MHKLLTFIAIAASFALGGCGTANIGDRITNALDKMPLVYRPTIQQGNVVTQDVINRLEPEMTKRQVRFVLGTPMMVDIFHQNRWDIIYTEGKGSVPTEIKRVALFFDNERLTRIEGDFRPLPIDEREEKKTEVIVSVPDWEGERKPFWRRGLQAVGIGDE